MSWATALPLIAGGVGAAGTLSAASSQAKALRGQSRETLRQSAQDEYQQRREGRDFMGRQAAAFAQAGIGYGGTSEMVIRDSAIKAELDALNIRYRGQVQSRALLAEAKNVKKQALFTAGAQLLSGAAGSYRASKV